MKWIYAKFSTACFIFCEAARLGGCCHMTFRLGARFITTIGIGGGMGRGKKSTTPCASSCANVKAETFNPAPPSWTAKASRRRKKGGLRLRCREESERPQTAYFDRYTGTSVDGGGTRRPCARPRWRVIRAGAGGGKIQRSAN